ncbi:hypothetical protein MJO28_017759, partial [Puccinia striiformis f. sp. tritici]
TNQPSPALSQFFQYPLPTNSSNLAINSNTGSVSLVKMPIHSKVLANHPLPLPKGNQEHILSVPHIKTSIDRSEAGGPGKVEDNSIIGVNSESDDKTCKTKTSKEKIIAKAKGKDSVTPAQKSGVSCHLDYQSFGDCFTHPVNYLSILRDQYPNNLQVICGQQKQTKDRIWISVDSVEPFVVPVIAGVTTFEHWFCTGVVVLLGSMTGIPTAIEWKRFTVQLALFMPNPADQVKRSKKEDILAGQAAHKLMLKESKSQKRQSADNDDSKPDDESKPEEIEPEDWDDVAFHMKNIFEKYKLKTDYDRYSPVFLDPGNDQRFKILTMAAAQERAMALVDRKDGVDMKSPPASLPWETLGKKRTVLMVEYLEFLGIPDLHKVLGLLTKEDIVSHTLFRSPALVRKDVRNLGIS